MPGPNLTGQPDTRDYLLGRGRVYFSAMDDSTGLPVAYRDLGNAPDFTINRTLEELKHKSSREGTAFTDASVVITTELGGSFTLDEWNHENLADLLSGAKSSPTNEAIGGFTQYEMIPSLELGRWYDLRDSDGNRAYNIDSSKLTVGLNGTTGTNLTLNTHYLLDATTGMIFILADNGLVEDGDGIDVTLTADGAAGDINRVDALSRTTVKGILKFISVNAANDGFEEEWVFWKTSLNADGDIALIGDDWAEMPFSFTAERNTLRPGSPTCEITSLAQS